jgi:DNA-binding transcriptional ArsR family regulator
MQVVTKTVQEAGADVFTAIAHPVRRQISDLLREEERPVKQLAASFEMSRPAISQHLKILLEVGLVAEQRAGRENYYRLQPERLQEVGEWLRHYEQFWNQKLEALGKFLDKAE